MAGRSKSTLAVTSIAITTAIVVMVISFNRSASNRDSSPAIVPPSAQPAPIGLPPAAATLPSRSSVPGTVAVNKGLEVRALSPEQQTIEQLLRAARAGDARAGCRVSRQLQDCVFLRKVPVGDLSKGFDSVEKALERAQDPANADLFAQAQIEMLRTVDRCRSVQPETLASMHHVLRKAALAGNRAAMLKYASGEFLGVDPGLEATRHPGYAAWRREAPSMLVRALQAGSLEAAFALGVAHAADHESLSAIIPDDPWAAAVYEMLVDLAQGDRPGTRQELSAAQKETALRRATKLHRDFFAGGLAPKEEAVLGPSWFNAADQTVSDPCG